MKKTRIQAGLAGTAALALIGATVAWVAPATGQQSLPGVKVYKSPTCGCCSKWVDHLRENGFEVTTEDVADIAAVKSTHGVPPALGSCHTAVIGNYVVEGHVPADVVKRMLREKPAFAGIAVPGMPIGSPGMEVGDRRDPYSIVSFDRSGTHEVYEKR